MDGLITQYDLFALFLVTFFSASLLVFFKIVLDTHKAPAKAPEENLSPLQSKLKVFAGGFFCTCSAVLFAGLVWSVSMGLSHKAEGIEGLSRTPATAD